MPNPTKVSRVRIKICGITSKSIAGTACAAGADAIGLMFYAPSPRHLELDQAGEITRSLPPYVTSVGVVVNPEADYVTQIIRTAGVDQLQFHGEETDTYCQSFGLPYIKVLRVADDVDLLYAERSYPGACGILLDTHTAELYGGSGKSFDWNRVNYHGSKPVILAGGLTPENIPQALEVASPYGVDVSTGVETGGTKDPEKIAAFCHNIRKFETASN